MWWTPGSGATPKNSAGRPIRVNESRDNHGDGIP